MALLMTGAMVSCAGYSDGPQQVPDDTAKMSIGFMVSAPSAARVRDAGGYENGTELEAAIDFAGLNYRVYFYDSNSTFITEWDQVTDVHVLKTHDYWVYTFTGSVPKALHDYNETDGGRDFYVMVLANWPDWPERHSYDFTGTSIDDLVTAEWSKFKAFDSYELSMETGRLIPLYGLQKYTGVELAPETTIDLGTVNLLRAMAKVEVNLSGLPDDVTLVGNPRIVGLNPEGYCAPVGTFGTGNNWNTDYVADLHLPFASNNNHAGAKDITAEMLTLTEGSKWIAYLPEFRNVAQTDYSRIELKLRYPYKEETFILDFANYGADGRPADDGRFDIRRNDLYRFNVTGDLHDLKFSVEITPWAEGGRTEIDMTETTE